jgi:Protease inhibitor Inh
MMVRSPRSIADGRQALRLVGIVSLAGLLLGCAERISFGGSGIGSEATEPLPAAPTGPVSSNPLAAPGAPGTATGSRTPPPVNMAGRWTLTAPGTGGCAMNFGATPGSPEGTIAPEGGCPGNFFTSRKWVFEDNGLVIRDHTGQPLARLAYGPSGRFDGQAQTGRAVTLAR